MKSRAALAIAVVLLAASAAPGLAQTWKSVAKSRQHRGQDLLDVHVKYAAGVFELSRGADRLLYRLDSRYDEDAFNLLSNYLESDGRGKLTVQIEGRDHFDLGDIKDYDLEGASLRLELSGATPLALRLELGAAEARLDLGGLRMRDLVLKTGASDTQVRFSEPNRETAEHCIFKAGAAAFKAEALGNSGCRSISVSGGVGSLALDFSGVWGHDARGDINVGLGTVEIHVPAELGVRIDRSTFLMSFDAPGFEKRDGGVWVSRNWETAQHRLTLSVSGALGGITVARL